MSATSRPSRGGTISTPRSSRSWKPMAPSRRMRSAATSGFLNAHHSRETIVGRRSIVDIEKFAERPAAAARLRASAVPGRDDFAQLGAEEEHLADNVHPQHDREQRPDRAVGAAAAAEEDAIERQEL